jgi:hypothetical protein
MEMDTTPKMGRWRRVIRAFGWTCAVCLGFAAQTAAQSTQPLWTLDFGANQTYDSNVRFTPDQPTGDWGTQLHVGLGVGWPVNTRATINVTSSAAQVFYRDSTDLSNFSYGAGAGFTYLVTRRLNWTATNSFYSGYAQDSRLLTDAGLVLAKEQVWTNAFSTTLGYDLSPRTQFRWTFGENGVVFGSPNLISGWSYSTGMTLSRQISRPQTLSVTYNYGQTVSAGLTGVVQSVFGTWQLAAGQSVTFSASGGVQPYTLPGESGFLFAPAGAAQLTVKVRTTETLNISYQTAIGQALGNTSTYLSRGVVGSYTWSLGARASVDGSGSYVRGTYPQIPDQILIGRTATANFRYRIAKNLSLATNASIYRRADQGVGLEPTSSYRLGLSVSYGTNWR